MVRLNVDIIIVVTTRRPCGEAGDQDDPGGVPRMPSIRWRPGWSPNLAHPGGNVTVARAQTAVLSAKRLELLKEVVPGLVARRGCLECRQPRAWPLLKETQSAAHALEWTLEAHELRDPGDFAGRFRQDRRAAPGRPHRPAGCPDAAAPHEIIAFAIRIGCRACFVAKEWVRGRRVDVLRRETFRICHRRAAILRGPDPEVGIRPICPWNS